MTRIGFACLPAIYLVSETTHFLQVLSPALLFVPRNPKSTLFAEELMTQDTTALATMLVT